MMSVANTTQAMESKSFDPYRKAEGAVEALMHSYKIILYRDTPHTVRKDPEALHTFRKAHQADLQKTATGLFEYIETFPPEGQAVLLKHAYQNAPVGDDKLQRHFLQKLHKVLTQVQDRTLRTQIDEWLGMQENPKAYHGQKLTSPYRSWTSFFEEKTTATKPKKNLDIIASAQAGTPTQNAPLLSAQADIAALMADYKVFYQTGQNTKALEADIEEYIRAAHVDERPALIAAVYREAYVHSALEKLSITMMLEVLPKLSDQTQQSVSHWLKKHVQPYEDLTQRYNTMSAAQFSNIPDQKSAGPYTLTGRHTRTNIKSPSNFAFEGP